MENAKIIASAPRFYVENIEDTLSFYINELGFNLIDTVPGFYGMIERDGFQIHFAKFNTQFSNKNQKQHLILWIPDIYLFWEEIQSKKINIIEEITLKPYGNKEFIIEDNNKNIITICD